MVEIVHTCTLCGNVEEEAIPMIPHQYEERIAKEPGYLTSGVKETACVMCGDVVRTELIPALWETWQQVVVICIPFVIIALIITLVIVIKKKGEVTMEDAKRFLDKKYKMKETVDA